MQEIAMNILDVAQNSVRAQASMIEITLEHHDEEGTLRLTIRDDGCGMDEETIKRATDPFFTTRTTRDVGLGLPFLQMAAEITGGTFSLESTPGKGTKTTACFRLGHIDMMPLGDMGETISMLLGANPDIDVKFTYKRKPAGGSPEECFVLDSREAREILGPVSLGEPEVVLFLKSHINENLAPLIGE